MFRAGSLDNRIRRGKSANMIPRMRRGYRYDEDTRSVRSGTPREFRVVARSNTRKEEDERSEISLQNKTHG